MDIYQLKRDYGRDIRLWGGLGSQSTLPFGKPDDVRTAVRRLKQELGCGGGYILSPAKPITEQVPLENVVACLEEAHRPVAR
jgi:uroporphyrinogen decarboxylase